MASKVTGTPPASILGSFLLSIEQAKWITEADHAAFTLGTRLAIALDTAFDSGDLKEIPALAQRFTTVLQQLHLTVETRTQAKGEEENDGSGIQGNYLRLLSTPTTKPATKSS